MSPRPPDGPPRPGLAPDGLRTAPAGEALAHDLRAHKEPGFDPAREHIGVEPDRWLHWAGRLGPPVWQDTPAPTTGRNPGTEARARYGCGMEQTLDGRISSPSIVTRVTFDEGRGQYDPGRIAEQAEAGTPAGWSTAGPGSTSAPTGTQATSWTSTLTPVPRSGPPGRQARPGRR